MLSAENFTQHTKRERLTGAVQSLYHLGIYPKYPKYSDRQALEQTV